MKRTIPCKLIDLVRLLAKLSRAVVRHLEIYSELTVLVWEKLSDHQIVCFDSYFHTGMLRSRSGHHP